MKYNANDGYFHCTNDERLALDLTTLENTSKYYEVDTKLSYEVYSATDAKADNTWYAL